MGKNQTEYVLSARGLSILQAKGYPTVCRLCGRPLKPGDKVRKQTKRGHVLAYVHVECYEKTLIEV